MIIDSSAIVAIAASEPEAEKFLDLIASEPEIAVSAATLVEAGIVIDGRRDPRVSRRFDSTLRDIGAVIHPLTEVQAQIARQAYRDFGRGSGHPARLNMGDCFSYALAKDLGQPLLFKGNDFTHTDVRVAG